MHSFTLGYADNSTLDTYFDAYKKILAELSSGVLADDARSSGDFLLIPDISTTIEAYANHKITKEYTQEFLENEWNLFQNGSEDMMVACQGAKIPGTDIRLTRADMNYDNKDSAHPDHQKYDVKVGWGNVSEEDWLSLYEESFGMLKRISPGFMYELDCMIRKIIPIGVSSKVHNSASYSSCIGHLYMSYPVNIDSPAIPVLEAIIHESNHNKLNLVMKTDPLVINTREEVYYSPYRPDPRHIHGVYLGLHALVAVISVFFRAISLGIFRLDDSDLRKSLKFHMKNALSIRVIEKYARLTALGQTILDEMKQVHHENSLLIRNLALPEKIIEGATKDTREHFLLAQKDCAYLRY